jgi:ABC-type transport system involved in multi-copper enzyme maturation permease subunit
MGAIYRLTLHQMSGRWRLLIMTVLASLPVITSILTLRSNSAPSVEEFENVVFSGMLAGSITPLIVLAIATAAFANEIEDRTLANLTLAPIPRWKIALPKILAAFTIAAPFIAIAAFVSSHVAFLGDATATFAVTTSALIAVALYATTFVWLGLVVPQAIGIGLAYIVLWEGLFSRYVAGVRLFSVRYYSLTFMNILDERRFASTVHPNAIFVTVASALVLAGFLYLCIRRLRRMDVP